MAHAGIFASELEDISQGPGQRSINTGCATAITQHFLERHPILLSPDLPDQDRWRAACNEQNPPSLSSRQGWMSDMCPSGRPGRLPLPRRDREDHLHYVSSGPRVSRQ